MFYLSSAPLIITLDVNVIETKFKQFWKELTFNFKMRQETQFYILQHPTGFYRSHHIWLVTLQHIFINTLTWGYFPRICEFSPNYVTLLFDLIFPFCQ